MLSCCFSPIIILVGWPGGGADLLIGRDGEAAVGKGADLAAAAAEQLLALVEQLCQVRPTVLVVDELQWADRVTLVVWSRLARLVRQLPLLLIGVLRPVPRRDDLRALRRIVGPTERLRLGRLAEPAVLELVATLAGGKPGEELLRLADGAAGNPLYLTELVDALVRSSCLVVDDAGIAELTGGPTPDSLCEPCCGGRRCWGSTSRSRT